MLELLFNIGDWIENKGNGNKKFIDVKKENEEEIVIPKIKCTIKHLGNYIDSELIQILSETKTTDSEIKEEISKIKQFVKTLKGLAKYLIDNKFKQNEKERNNIERNLLLQLNKIEELLSNLNHNHAKQINVHTLNKISTILKDIRI